MDTYDQQFDDLIRSLRADCRVSSVDGQGDDYTVSVDRTSVFISRDSDAGRVVLWGLLAGLATNETMAAAVIASEFNHAHFGDEGLSMGVSISNEMVVVGHSVEIAEAGSIGSLMGDFVGQLSRAQSYLDRGLQDARAKETEYAASLVAGGLAVRV